MQKDIRVIQIGNVLEGSFDNPTVGRVYDRKGLCPTLNTMNGGGKQPMIVEKIICGSRGRNPENPSDRSPGNYVEQTLEVNSEGIANTLTTVQKDNLVLILEKQEEITSRAEQSRADSLCPASYQRRKDSLQASWISRLSISDKQDKKRKSDREWADMPNTDNGEYP